MQDRPKRLKRSSWPEVARPYGAVVPKLVGFEIELGNHLVQAATRDSASRAAKALVQAHGRLFPSRLGGPGAGAGEFDGDGFRFYLDHEHAEISSPLVPSAARLVQAMRQARLTAARCVQTASQEVGPMRVSFNNTNRHGTAWAFHGNFLVSRMAFNRWRDAHWAPLRDQWLPFVATSSPLFGTGKVGAENGAEACPFQFSQRADFLDGEIGLETVTSKALINTRDEALADPERYARFHVIAWDTNLMEFATWLKFGTAQILLALIEEQAPLPALALKDPVRAAHMVSRDLHLRTQLDLENGRRETALGLQRRLAVAAARAIQAGGDASQVPDAPGLVRAWMETIDALEARAPKLSRRLDWCAKVLLLRRSQAVGQPDLETLQALDLQYAEVDGLFERLEQTGGSDRLEDFTPANSLHPRKHAWPGREQARALLIGKFGRHLAHVDWEGAVLLDESGGLWCIPMDDPLDGADLLRVVRRAATWPSCLDRLIKSNLAHPVAVNKADGSPALVWSPAFRPSGTHGSAEPFRMREATSGQ